MLLKEILSLFEISIQLPSFLYEIEVSDIFAHADLEIKNNVYIITEEDAILTIDPNDKKNTISELYYQDNMVVGGTIYSSDSMIRILN